MANPTGMGTMTARDTLTDVECDAIADSVVPDRDIDLPHYHALIRAAYAAGAASVPRKPTREMILAGNWIRHSVKMSTIIDEWQAMHDAATGVTK